MDSLMTGHNNTGERMVCMTRKWKLRSLRSTLLLMVVFVFVIVFAFIFSGNTDFRRVGDTIFGQGLVVGPDQGHVQNMQHPQQVRSSKTNNATKKKAREGGVVFFVPQIGKSGSSTFRDMFDKRGRWFKNPRMDNWEVRSEIYRKCRKEESKPMNHENQRARSEPYYPFAGGGRWKWTQFYWVVHRSFDPLVDPECMDNVIRSSWKFWKDAVESKNASGGVSYGRYPKPVIQTNAPCPPSETWVTSTVKCRRLVQIRHPVSWIESHFGYFCKDCSEKNKFCGGEVDAKCGPKHREKGDHETVQSWARKFGNVFTRKLHSDKRMLAGGTWEGGVSPDGWTHQDILELPKHVDEVLQIVKEEEHCIVALEDPHRLSKIEACLGDRPGFYRDKFGYTDKTTRNTRKESKKVRLDPNITAELREILAADISLYNSLFPFLADNDV